MATSHKRETARRTPRAGLLAGSLAAMATTVAVGAGVLGSSTPDTADLRALDKAAAGSVDRVARDLPALSRDSDRSADMVATKLEQILDPEATRQAIANATKKRWTTADLNLWDGPSDDAKKVGELTEGKRVVLTGRKYDGRSEIVLDGAARWVSQGHFSTEEPPKLGGDCTNGTSVASGTGASIRKVHAAVCANFPEIRVYGTLRGGGGDHPRGKAVDIMVSGARGQAVADFVRANASALGVSYVIYAQRIWSVERSGEGWRRMSNRGGATANHYDHVHVSAW